MGKGGILDELGRPTHCRRGGHHRRPVSKLGQLLPPTEPTGSTGQEWPGTSGEPPEKEWVYAHTFTGAALTGPLAAAGVTLEQISVVASTWGDWKEEQPETRIIAEDGGIGRTYLDDPLGGRESAGPIFPVGDVDPRLPSQERVVGVIAPNGTPVAFPVVETRTALSDGPIEFEGLTVRLEDSIRVYDSEGNQLVSHEAFWFAWSQFHEGTLL